jgi:hypothetical protein
MLRKLFKSANESLLFWSLSPIVSWTVWGFVIGIPVHSVFGICPSSIALCIIIQCALQIIANQWLFKVRAKVGNPKGDVERRWIIVWIWLTAACEALFLQVFLWDVSNPAAIVIGVSTPLALGFVFVLGRRWFLKFFGLEASA